jgi:hypothetical protein
MPEQTGFGFFLIGATGRQRPPFFYGYIALWIHLLIAVPVLLLGVQTLGLGHWGLAVWASLCAGLALYGLLSRRWEFLSTLGAYALCLYLLFEPTAAPGLFLAALLPPLGALYALIRLEFARYTPSATASSWPAWPAQLAMGLGLLCLLLGLAVL